MVAERAVQLDHMTRGRFMLGCGPGSLPTDAIMLGLDPTETRPLLEEGMDVIMKLLTTDEPVSSQTKMWNLVDARLHLRPYSNPLFDVAVPAVASPSGPRLAGKHGIGLLSIGATQEAGFDALGLHWDVMEERAAKFGTVADRAKWRLVGLMHIAETREQAYRDVEYGILNWFDYFQHTAAFPQMDVGSSSAVREAIDFVNQSGLGSIGTVEDAVDQIDRLVKQSGGFGCYMALAHEWANPEATKRSFELIAQDVFPHFQGQAYSTLASKERARASRETLAERNMQAVTDMVEKHQAELASE
jgi:limonene 1,2-monooxygenase